MGAKVTEGKENRLSVELPYDVGFDPAFGKELAKLTTITDLRLNHKAVDDSILALPVNACSKP
jgi:hypothetical protein